MIFIFFNNIVTTEDTEDTNLIGNNTVITISIFFVIIKSRL
jgi:hypothetical protein